MRFVIGQFYCILLYDPLKFKAVFVAKMFRDLSPSVVNFYSKWKFNAFFYLNCVFKYADDLTT